MRRALMYAAGVAAVWLGAVPEAGAHEGPPFPIVMDRRTGPYIISVWTDPDVGVEKGKFFVILEPAPGTNLPDELDVQVCVRPTSGRLEEVCYSGTRQDLHDRVQYYAEVDFDQQEMWKVRVRVKGAGGTGEVTTEVEATPPGYGAWDLLIYGFPFVLFGMLWLYAALRRRAARASNAAAVPVSAAVVPSARPSENGVPTGAK